MSQLEIAKLAHLLSAAVWGGGLIVLAALVAAVRAQTDDREVLRVMARRYSVVSWVALAFALGSGLWLYYTVGWADPKLFEVKWSLITVAIGVTFIHQVFAKRMSPAVRGITQVIILVLTIGVFAAAVSLPG
jgi:putative copper export protein